MASTLRRQRIADRIRAELSDLLQREVSDPRLELVTITDVKVDRELAFADVFVSTVSVPGPRSEEERQREVMGALHGAAGYLRREAGARIRLRNTPQLRFHWDPSPERGEHLAQLLDSIRSPAAANAPEAERAQPPEASGVESD